MYGGLGDDWLHGGAGDDAMSGAEALAYYYTADPLATLAALSAYYAVGNVLQHAYRPAQPEEFRWFNENDPWRKIMVAPAHRLPAQLQRAARPPTPVDDGQDVLFGDTGHDWLVGGTNHDRMYGGYGDDLLQGDDNLDSTAGTADPLRNDIPDTRATAPVFADIGFGGAGHDVMIVNTAVDRMYRLERRVQQLLRDVQPVRRADDLAAASRPPPCSTSTTCRGPTAPTGRGPATPHGTASRSARSASSSSPTRTGETSRAARVTRSPAAARTRATPLPSETSA